MENATTEQPSQTPTVQQILDACDRPRNAKYQASYDNIIQNIQSDPTPYLARVERYRVGGETTRMLANRISELVVRDTEAAK